MVARRNSNEGSARRRDRIGLLILAVVLVVAWCAFIFYMSARPADESGAISGGFSFDLLSLVWPDFRAMSAIDQQYWCDAIDYPVRKCAHFSEYALLGLLATNLGLRAKRHVCADHFARLDKWNYVLVWALATLYAVSDEIHQAFVFGRACLATDVMIDSGGVLVGIVLFVVLPRAYGIITTTCR